MQPGDAIRVEISTCLTGVTAVTAEDETIVQVEAVYQEAEEVGRRGCGGRRRPASPPARKRRARSRSVVATGPASQSRSGQMRNANMQKTRVGQLSDPRPLASRRPCLSGERPPP